MFYTTQDRAKENPVKQAGGELQVVDDTMSTRTLYMALLFITVLMVILTVCVALVMAKELCRPIWGGRSGI